MTTIHRELHPDVAAALCGVYRVQRVRRVGDEIHAFGRLPNSDNCGWYFLGFYEQLVGI